MRSYREILSLVLNHGRQSRPRGLDTLDLDHVTIEFTHPQSGMLAIGTGRGLSLRIAAVEAIQLIGGFHDPEMMVWASRNFERFREGKDTEFYGAYGRRIGDQFMQVALKLMRDPDTRQ